MKTRYRSAAATAMIAALVLAAPLTADSGGGTSTTEESSSNDMTYITIGLAVLVGGYLIYDAITDSGNDDTETDSLPTAIVDTGVDWDHAVSQGGDGIATVAVSILPGPDGNQLSMQLIGAMREMVDETVEIYEDPIDLGSGPEIQRAALAREFFGVDYLVFMAAGSDSMVTFGVASPDSIVWTSTDQSDNNMLVVASEIVQAGIF